VRGGGEVGRESGVLVSVCPVQLILGEECFRGVHVRAGFLLFLSARG
jgi:hypothetical protein